MLDFQAARYLVSGEVAKQAGNNHPTSIPTGVFKTKDGHINIAATGQKIWERFCEAADATALLQKPEYPDGAARSKNRDALNAEIDNYLANRTSAEWVERLNKAGVPCGPIYAIDQMFADPQVQHLGIAQSVTKKDKSKMRLSASRSRCRARRRGSSRGRRKSASIPMRCSRNSAFRRATSPRCTRRRRCDGSYAFPGRSAARSGALQTRDRYEL